MNITRTTIVGVSFLALATSAAAFTTAYSSSGKSDLAQAFCPKIYNEQSYRGGDLDHYAMLIPGKGGWIFRTKNDFRSDWKNSNQTINYLRDLQEAFKKKNADLVIVMPPVRGLVHFDEMLSEYKKKFSLENPETLWNDYESSIKILKGRGVHMVGLNAKDVTDNFFYQRNHHWSPEGARITAKKVAEYVMQLPSYKAVPKTRYATQQKSTKDYDSSFEKAFKTICGTKIPPEPVAVYETTPVSVGSNETAILGEAKEPRIVLLGTSNSTESSSANFEGFLKEYLSADILNLSYMGAGIDTSIMSYINSDHFKNSKPKIVIWEVPGYYYFDEMDDKLFSQLTPAAYGGCPQNALLQKNFKLGAAEITVLNAKTEKMSSSSEIEGGNRNLYMHLGFSRPVKNKLALKFSYDNGKTKKVQFQRSDRYPDDGDFYTLFPFKTSGTSLEKITLLPPQGMAGEVVAQICKLPETGKVVSR
jgi:alginate biosynthesis protein AlgX